MGNTMEKRRIVIRVAGRDYTVLSYDTEEYMQRVAQTVDRQISDIATATRVAQSDAAVLTCLSFCDELLKAQDENRHLRAELERAHARYGLTSGAQEETV